MLHFVLQLCKVHTGLRYKHHGSRRPGEKLTNKDYDILVADQGFPRGGGAIPKGGALTYYSAKCFPKTA